MKTLIQIFICVLVILIACMDSMAGRSRNTVDTDSDYITSVLWGGAWDTFLDDPYVYCAYPMGLGILDVSDPLEPIMISTLYCPGFGKAITKCGDLIYLSDGPGGLFIIDVTDPVNPFIVGSYTALNDASDIFTRDSLAFIVCNDSFVIINVANPSWPIRIGAYAVSTEDQIEGLDVSGNLAIMAAGEQGVEIADITDLTDPVLLATFPEYKSRDIAVRDSLAFVLGDGRLLILNIADPYEPDSIACLLQRGIKLELIDSLAIVSFRYDASTGPPDSFEWYVGFNVINVHDPATPALLGGDASGQGIEVPLSPTTIMLDTLALVFNSYPGIEVFGISDLANTRWIKTVPQGAARLISEDSLLYVIPPGFLGFYILNASNPLDPSLVSGYHVDPNQSGIDTIHIAFWRGGFPCNLAVGDTLVYIPYYIARNLECILEVVNVSDPSNPVTVARPSLGSEPYFLAPIQVIDTLMILGDLIYNISDPVNPIELGSLGISGVRDLLVCDTIIYACDYYSSMLRLRVFNIVDPTNPIELTDPFNLDCYFWELSDMYLRNNLLYIIFSSTRGSIFDVSDPSQVIRVGYRALPNGRDIDIYEDHVYVATGRGVSICDISDPAIPVAVDSISTPGEASDALIKDGTLFIADKSSLLVFTALNSPTDVENDRPAELPHYFTLGQNYPNPFNPFTTIKYELSRTSQVDITVYNMLGQTVANLVDEYQPAGRYVIKWNGTNNSGQIIASGVYFYRITAGDFIASKKMVLLK